MTPKEFDFLVTMIEEVSRRAYTDGHNDGKGAKPLKTQGFSMNKASKMTLKTMLKKHAEMR